MVCRVRVNLEYAQSDQKFCWSLEPSMTVKLLTEHRLESLSLTGSCTGSSESTLVKMSHYLKSHVAAHFLVENKTYAFKCRFCLE